MNTEKKKVGRPPLGDRAMTDVEKQAKHRKLIKERGAVVIKVTLEKDDIEDIKSIAGDLTSATLRKLIILGLDTWSKN